MKTHFIEQEFLYDGTQLSPLYAYLNHGVLGDSIISWIGACDISFSNMKDGEDLLDHSAIQGSKMLHFIVEVFHQDLMTGVALQRLLASIVKDYIQGKSLALKHELLVRKGDDIYWEDKKLSISIASQSTVATQIHFAINISTAGTPVKTTSLEELKLDSRSTAIEIMNLFKAEFDDIVIATKKVKPL